MAVHLWNFLSVGLNTEFKIEKRKFWFELVPGLAFKAVWFGRQRKRWFSRETEYLVLYRNDIHKESQCEIAWIPVSQLIEREMSKNIDKDYVCHDKELNKLFDNILKDATVKNIE